MVTLSEAMVPKNFNWYHLVRRCYQKDVNTVPIVDIVTPKLDATITATDLLMKTFGGANSTSSKRLQA